MREVLIVAGTRGLARERLAELQAQFGGELASYRLTLTVAKGQGLKSLKNFEPTRFRAVVAEPYYPNKLFGLWFDEAQFYGFTPREEDRNLVMLRVRPIN